MVVMIGIAACTTAAPKRVAGWKVDPNYTPPTRSYLLLHGPADQIAEIIEQSRAFGWSPQEHTALPSGSAFALMSGPTEIEPNERMWDLLMSRPIIVGPGLAPESRHGLNR
jgi:hypothetical protein